MKALTLTFNNAPIHATRDAWFNATDMAKVFGKRPNEWLRLPETQEYINALTRNDNTGLSRIIKIKKGKNGGTWLHRKLAVPFARWLSADFAVWCDERIEELLSGGWQQSRDTGKAHYRMLTEVIQMVRLEQGKDIKPQIFINDAKLIGWALTGVFKGIDRDQLNKAQIDAINDITRHNAALFMKGLSYNERKPLLWEYAAKYRNNLVEVAL